MIKKTIMATTILVAFASTSAMAYDSKIGIGASVGTTGYGGDVTWRFHNNLALSAGYNQISIDDIDVDSDEVQYNGDLDFKNTSLKLEYYPFGGAFFLSGGVIDASNDINVVATSNSEDGSFQVGDNSHPSSAIESIDGKAELTDGIAPYLGLGWKSSNKSGFGFYSELGVYYLDPSVNLTANYDTTGVPASVQAQIQSDVQKEEDDLEDEFNKYNLYPVAKLGIQYVF